MHGRKYISGLQRLMAFIIVFEKVLSFEHFAIYICNTDFYILPILCPARKRANSGHPPGYQNRFP